MPAARWLIVVGIVGSALCAAQVNTVVIPCGPAREFPTILLPDGNRIVTKGEQEAEDLALNYVAVALPNGQVVCVHKIMEPKDYAEWLKALSPLKENEAEIQERIRKTVELAIAPFVPLSSYNPKTKQNEPLTEQDRENAIAQLVTKAMADYDRLQKADIRSVVVTPMTTLPIDAGSPEDQYKMGMMYDLGTGVPQDSVKAVESFLKAAEQDHVLAQAKVGLAFYTGHGVSKDYAQAAKWTRLAAEQGDKDAQALLALCFFQGEGVAQDYVESYRWANLASVEGEKLYVQLRDTVAARMTATQIDEARRLSSEWKPVKTR
jgi:hypothetical protein